MTWIQVQENVRIPFYDNEARRLQLCFGLEIRAYPYSM